MSVQAPRVSASTGDVCVIELTGDHDFSTSRRLCDHIDDALCRGNDIIVDVEHATFIDSTILGVILRGAQMADRCGPLVFLVCAPLGSPARRLLDLVSIGRELTTTQSRAEALHFVQTLR